MPIHTPFGLYHPSPSSGGSEEHAANRDRETNASQPFTALAPASILLVGRDAHACAEMGASLNLRGHIVTLASVGPTAEVLRQSTKFDLIICEIGTPPYVDRLWLEKFVRTATGPVLLLTAQISLNLAADGLDLPVAGCLAQPVDPVALDELLARTLGGAGQ